VRRCYPDDGHYRAGFAEAKGTSSDTLKDTTATFATHAAISYFKVLFAEMSGKENHLPMHLFLARFGAVPGLW
jgi:hypothetical protein